MFRSFNSHPHRQLQALKSVPRLGLEAWVLTLEHIFVKKYCQEHEFLAQTLTSSSRHLKVSGCEASNIDFRVSFGGERYY